MLVLWHAWADICLVVGKTFQSWLHGKMRPSIRSNVSRSSTVSSVVRRCVDVVLLDREKVTIYIEVGRSSSWPSLELPSFFLSISSFSLYPFLLSPLFLSFSLSLSLALSLSRSLALYLSFSLARSSYVNTTICNVYDIISHIAHTPALSDFMANDFRIVFDMILCRNWLNHVYNLVGCGIMSTSNKRRRIY